MHYKLRISVQAQGDIESIYRYVFKDGESIAKKQADVIYSSLENLQLFPEMGANLSTYTIEKNDYFTALIEFLNEKTKPLLEKGFLTDAYDLISAVYEQASDMEYTDYDGLCDG